MNKLNLLKKFQRKPEKYWKVGLFDKEGFIRKICPVCNKGFWTLDESRVHCSNPICGEPYTFIGSPVTRKKMDLIETWKEFEKYFVKRGHRLISRFPVISRWHPTLWFTIASIQDFMRIEPSGLVFEYPYHTLIVPQVCLRFSDIESVGLTGKHHTCFIMPGQHSFNYPDEGYFKDGCIELNFEFLTEIMGIPKEELIYIEDFWSMPDFSLFGPYLETHSLGLELVNSGFLGFQKSNGNYKEIPIKVIDVGWGLERLTWFSNGTPTGYDCVFGPVIEKLKKVCEIEYDENIFLKYAKGCGKLNMDEIEDMISAKASIAKQLGISLNELEKNIEPLVALYSIADHTRALAFALADNGIISNVGGGYNLRVILRRALSFIDKFKWDVKLEDIVFWHVDYLKEMFPELAEHKNEIVKILDVEEKRYRQTKERSKRIVKSFIKENKIPSEEELIKLYDSDGITPEQLKEAGLEIKIPSDFYARVTERHMGKKIKEEKLRFDVSGLPKTKLLFYENPDLYEFEAKVLRVFDNWIVLDQTCFFPTSGGQLHDKGFVDSVEVLDVQKFGNVVIHKLAKEVKNRVVKCRIDKERRKILKRHHTATHIVNYAARKVLGKHVWQHGSEKDVDKARLDITHYEALTEKEIEKIENLANGIVEKNLKVKTEVLPRGKAEQKYGFMIYQGGAIPEKMLRIVYIDNIDFEACGGIHCKNTGEVGFISILRTKRIADGLVRLEYCSGEVALNNLKEKEKILKEVAKKLKVREEDVPETVKNLFAKWKKLRKKIKKR